MDEQAKEYLLKIPFWTKKKNTLEQIKDFLVKLGNPESGLAIIHVAGTNGKGSVCADLTAVLKEAGYRVGTFVSPHLTDIRERFLIDGQPADEKVFEDCFRQVLTAVRSMEKQGYCHPSFFEFVFLMAVVMFAQEKVDYVILETGLGGRLDATNAIAHPKACVITSISRDHTRYLGETIPEIAAEKAGIIKAGVPVVYDDSDPSASKVIRDHAWSVRAPSYPVGEKEWEGEKTDGFAAPYQARNAALARKVLQILKVPGVEKEMWDQAMKKVCWPGRMEEAAPEVWLDGAHNPGGIRAFAEAVKEQMKKEKKQIQLLFGAVADKDYEEMVHLLCDLLPISRVTVVHLRSGRGLEENVLASLFREAGCKKVTACKTVKEALKEALRCRTEEDRLYIVGSLYLIGEVKEILSRYAAEKKET